MPYCTQVMSSSFATPWTIANQAPLSMKFSRQEDCSRLPFPSPGDLPDPGVEPVSLVLPAWTGRLFNHSSTWEENNLIWRLTLLRQVSLGDEEFTHCGTIFLFLYCIFYFFPFHRFCVFYPSLPLFLPAGVSWTVCFSFLAAFSLIFLMLLLLCYSLSLNCFFLTFSRKMSLR